MTAEKSDQSIGESGGANCSTECSSTTPHLGTNETVNDEENTPDVSSCSRKHGSNVSESEKFTNTSSKVH